MNNRLYDGEELYADEVEYFRLHGSAGMRLSPEAAARVCEIALSYGHVITVIEGGNWCNPGFEARGDCIWWGEYSTTKEAALLNNGMARDFIEFEKETISVFIISSAKLINIII